jgi:hypothetical protein
MRVVGKGRGLGLCSKMHYHTFASAICAVRVERTTASAGEVVVAHPAPGTVDGMSGDLGEKRAVCGWDRSWVVCIP